MMKSTRGLIPLTILTLCVSTRMTFGQGKFGVGFIFGDPTGISWKYRINAVNAVDGVVGFSPFDRFRFHIDYLWSSHPFHERNLSVYYGVGGAFGFGRTEYITRSGRFIYIERREPLGFGARIPLGLNYTIPRSPVELMLEFAPILVLAPDTEFSIDAGVGARFYP